MDPEERAREGVFLAFQYPVEIPGVTNTYFLQGRAQRHPQAPRPDRSSTRMEFLELVKEKMKLLEMDDELPAAAPVNEGFSGGEKKRNEIFQMAVLEPKLAHPRRDRLRPRHRRAARSSPTASTRCAARTAPCSSSRTTSGCSNYIVPDFVHVLVGRPHRQDPAARSWRSSSRRRATTGSKAPRSARSRRDGRLGEPAYQTTWPAGLRLQPV